LIHPFQDRASFTEHLLNPSFGVFVHDEFVLVFAAFLPNLCFTARFKIRLTLPGTAYPRVRRMMGAASRSNASIRRRFSLCISPLTECCAAFLQQFVLF
jgi:hypothetical protein